MPGSGKSRIGRALAHATGKQFLDADRSFRSFTGISPNEYLLEYGEDEFRRIESNLLRKNLCSTDLVLSTGGGVILRAENRALLKEKCTVILLLRSLDRLPLSGRPISREKGVDKLWAERRPLYEACADHTVVNTEGDPAGTVRKILAWLECRDAEVPN